MSVYSNYEKLKEVVDCKEFDEQLDNLVMYMKLRCDNTSVSHDNAFDWMAIIETGEYDDAEMEEDIENSGDWEEDDLSYIIKTLKELNYFFALVLRKFEQETGVILYLNHHYEEYYAYFSFNSGSVFKVVAKLKELQKEAIWKHIYLETQK